MAGCSIVRWEGTPTAGWKDSYSGMEVRDTALEGWEWTLTAFLGSVASKGWGQTWCSFRTATYADNLLFPGFLVRIIPEAPVEKIK